MSEELSTASRTPAPALAAAADIRQAMPPNRRDELEIILDRLLTDDRMNVVWEVLNRRHPDGTLLYPGRRPPWMPSNADQATRLRELASKSVKHTDTEVARRHRASAKVYQSAPDRFSPQDAALYGVMFNAYHAYAIHMRTATQAEVLRLPYPQRRSMPPDAYIVQRRRSDPRLQAYCSNVALGFRDIFLLQAPDGSIQPAALYGITATLASVVFQDNITADAVRKMTSNFILD